MKKKRTGDPFAGAGLLAAFAVWTVLIQCIDVRPAGVNGTAIGLAAVNLRFHGLTGVHMALYTLTDWLGLVPIFICLCFAGLGAAQLIGRRSLRKVDADILLLGVYYVLVIAGYLFFESFVINYRPILINGIAESSYPSSTTLLVLGVLPTLGLQVSRRCGSAAVITGTNIFVAVFSAFTVFGRLLSGVHWLSDIIGAVLLSGGLFLLYRAAVTAAEKKEVSKSCGGGAYGVP